jgi:hypothetical protein
MCTSWSKPTPLDFHFGSSEGRNQLRSLIRQYKIGTIKLNGQVGLLDQLPKSFIGYCPKSFKNSNFLSLDVVRPLTEPMVLAVHEFLKEKFGIGLLFTDLRKVGY